jgi:hypothetical protein
VRVRAENESQARGVVASSSATSSPSADEIRLANQAAVVMGKEATIVAVDFSVDPEQAFPGHGQMKPEQLEIARLKREVTKLKATKLARTFAPSSSSLRLR